MLLCTHFQTTLDFLFLQQVNVLVFKIFFEKARIPIKQWSQKIYTILMEANVKLELLFRHSFSLSTSFLFSVDKSQRDVFLTVWSQ